MARLAAVEAGEARDEARAGVAALLVRAAARHRLPLGEEAGDRGQGTHSGQSANPSQRREARMHLVWWERMPRVSSRLVGGQTKGGRGSDSDSSPASASQLHSTPSSSDPSAQCSTPSHICGPNCVSAVHWKDGLWEVRPGIGGRIWGRLPAGGK